MSETIELHHVWDHTITRILNYYLKSEMIKEWVVFNKLEDFNSLLNYINDDFTPAGYLYYTNDNDEMLSNTTLPEYYSIRWFIQHLIDKYGYEYGDDDYFNSLSESNWIYQTNKHFMKYVIFTLEEMTPEQLKMNQLSKLISMKNLIEMMGSLPKMKRNPSHLKNFTRRFYI